MPKQPNPRPNVLLLHAHDLGRFLGCYGVPTVRTPALDGLAADGVRLANAFCTAPQCSPSRAALFTGRYPHSTGVMGLTHHRWDLYEDERHIAELLRAAGYRTDLIGIHHESLVRPDAEVAERLGFDTVDTLGEALIDQRAELVADRAVEVLTERAATPEQPFYLQVGFLEPHRLPSRTFDGVTMGFTGDHMEPDDSLGVTVPGYLREDAGAHEEVAELQGAVAYMDAAVGRVLAHLDALGLTENTVTVFTTDHGLALPRAKCTLYDPGLETALLVRAPGLGWGGGRVVDDLVSNVDLVPTLLEAAGVEAPANLHGHSLARALSGEDGAAQRDVIFGELTYHNYYDPRRCVRSDRFKLIVNLDHALAHTAAATQSWRPRSTPHAGHMGWPSGKFELYDLHSDPWEAVDLADDPEYRDTLEELRGRLLHWMTDTADPLLNGPVPSPSYAYARELLTRAPAVG
ncbi:sulfatase family protein [Streptomyces sp. BH106]|uniref:sulfatase family protein n=1 Tax=Streptomyces sp. BH106 TaxID=3410409 RepID=UPI003CEBC8F8